MIVLMRHAQTSGGKGRCIGRTPISLSDGGREQAGRLAETWRGIRFMRLCSSPSQRALDTIAPLAGARCMPVETLAGLDEIDMGTWDGLAFEDIRDRFPEAYAQRGSRFGTFRPANGESFTDVADRAMDMLIELAAGPFPVLAATHAGVIRSMLCKLTGHPLDDLFHFTPTYLGCTLVRPTPTGPELVATGLSPEAVLSYFPT